MNREPCEAELWFPTVIEWVRNPVTRDTKEPVDLTKGVGTHFVLKHAIGLDEHEMTNTRIKAIGRCLRSLGFQWRLCSFTPRKKNDPSKRECRYFPNYDVLGEYPDDD